MALCDVCARPTAGDVVADEAFRTAVREGYNPFSMGSVGPTLEQIATMAKISEIDPYDMWRAEVERRRLPQWQVCAGCLPALRPYLTPDAARRDGAPPGAAAGGNPTVCGRCGGRNPASQWHCSHCGRVQWGLIGLSLAVAAGLILWIVNQTSVTGRIVTGLFAALFLWMGVGSIVEARRDRNR